MRKDDVKQNILSGQQWLRILLMLGFVILSWLLRFGQLAIVIIQVLFALISGRANNNMRRAGTLLSLYQAQIWLYLSYSSERKPYPFTDLPEDGEDLNIDEELGYDEALEDEVRDDGAARRDDVFSDMSFTGNHHAAEGRTQAEGGAHRDQEDDQEWQDPADRDGEDSKKG